jgi:arylformamidase
MRKFAFALLAASVTLAVTVPTIASHAQSRRAERGAERSTRADAAMQTLSYGTDEEQVLDYWPGATRDAPLVIFVHGGGWKRGDKNMMHGSPKLTHWQAAGYAVASINYRLVPDGTVEQQGADVASAVAFLKNGFGGH